VFTSVRGSNSSEVEVVSSVKGRLDVLIAQRWRWLAVLKVG
jgi:hypothetical protein